MRALVYDAATAFASGGQDALRDALERAWVAVRALATGALIPAGAGKVVLIGPRPDAGHVRGGGAGRAREPGADAVGGVGSVRGWSGGDRPRRSGGRRRARRARVLPGLAGGRVLHRAACSSSVWRSSRPASPRSRLATGARHPRAWDNRSPDEEVGFARGARRRVGPRSDHRERRIDDLVLAADPGQAPRDRSAPQLGRGIVSVRQAVCRHRRNAADPHLDEPHRGPAGVDPRRGRELRLHRRHRVSVHVAVRGHRRRRRSWTASTRPPIPPVARRRGRSARRISARSSRGCRARRCRCASPSTRAETSSPRPIPPAAPARGASGRSTRTVLI